MLPCLVPDLRCALFCHAAPTGTHRQLHIRSVCHVCAANNTTVSKETPPEVLFPAFPET